ncbi:hypothetical protein I3760_13G157200 [Carya illinoinensis]|nr:hypothetical protein I3760_13G157200 [Carya illinoinensis]
MATNVPSTIVLQDISKDYKDWSDCIMNYLSAHHLWDVIGTTREPPKPEDNVDVFEDWKKKNADAVDAILKSCGAEIATQIKDITSAKTVWNTLATMYKERQLLEQTNRVAEISSSTAGSSQRRKIQARGFTEYATLYNAVREGQWDVARDFLENDPNSLSARITQLGQTALHVAVVAQQDDIVEKLVEVMFPGDLEIRDDEGLTALAETAIRGSLQMAKCMINRNGYLITIGNKRGLNIPLVLALRFERSRKLVHFLYVCTPLEVLQSEKGSNGATVVTKAINTGNFYIALDLIRKCPSLSTSLDTDKISPMSLLAGMSYVFPSGNRQPFWTRCIYSCLQIDRSTLSTHSDARLDIENDEEETTRPMSNIPLGQPYTITRLLTGLLVKLAMFLTFGLVKGFKHLYEIKFLHLQSQQLLHNMCFEDQNKPLLAQVGAESGISQAIFSAIRAGIFEFLSLVMEKYPELLWIRDSEGRNILMSAVQHQRAEVFRLIYRLKPKEIKIIISARDNFSNNILHIAGASTASTPLDYIIGAALQMQRELQWFKVSSPTLYFLGIL